MRREHLLEPLERDVREALEVERIAVSAPDDARARVLDRVTSTVGLISTSVASGGGRPDPGSGTRAAASARTGAQWWASPLWHVASFALGSMAGILGWRATQAALPPKVVYVDRALPAAPAPVPTVSAAFAPVLSPASLAAQAPPSAPATPGDSLAAERALLDIARSAFGRGEGDEALVALARHEKLFPGGQLAEEREALAVRSLVLGEHVSEARARGARFRRRYPTSVMLPAVEASLGTLP